MSSMKIPLNLKLGHWLSAEASKVIKLLLEKNLFSKPLYYGVFHALVLDVILQFRMNLNDKSLGF